MCSLSDPTHGPGMILIFRPAAVSFPLSDGPVCRETICTKRHRFGERNGSVGARTGASKWEEKNDGSCIESVIQTGERVQWLTYSERGGAVREMSTLSPIFSSMNNKSNAMSSAGS